jgi:hypothetical protein
VQVCIAHGNRRGADCRDQPRCNGSELGLGDRR